MPRVSSHEVLSAGSLQKVVDSATSAQLIPSDRRNDVVKSAVFEDMTRRIQCNASIVRHKKSKVARHVTKQLCNGEIERISAIGCRGIDVYRRPEIQKSLADA